MLPKVKFTPDKNRIESNNYTRLTDILRTSWLGNKNLDETVVLSFGIKVNKIIFISHLSNSKLYKLFQLL